jgi:uncharacterized membrane protein YbhN (UPF0104 family)
MPPSDSTGGDLLGLEDLGPSVGSAVGEVSGRWRTVTWARRMFVVVALGVGVAILLLNAKRSQSAVTTLAQSRPWWIAALVCSTVVTYAMAATCTIGSSTAQLSPPKTFLMQVASSFVNRFVPGGIAGAVLNVRFVERSGATRSAAVTANLLNNSAGLVVHLVMFLALLPFFGGLHRDIDPPDNYAVFVAMLVGLVGVGAVIWVRWIPHHLKALAASMRVAATEALRSPRRIVLLVGGSVGVTAAHGLGLWSALRAVGAPISLADVLVIYLAAAAAASLSPTPGGLGAIEAALVAGLTHSGTAVTPAAAAVIAYRIVTYWLPIIPGLLAFRWLRRANAI